MAVTVSAVICTRNRPDQLRRALRSLRTQSVAPSEILVIDNAPFDECLRELVAHEFPGVRYVREPIPGLDFARNRALRAANAEIVAFLDDDAVADREWVRVITGVFDESSGVGACTGRVAPLSLDTEGQRLFEANGGFARGGERVRLPADARRQLHGWPAPLIAWAVSVGSGCSLAIRRAEALALGGFDEALDLGTALPGGGDHDMLWRMLAGGREVVYEPTALAQHEHRRELAEVFDQIVGHQRALIALLTKTALQARGARRFPVIGFLVWRLLKPGVRLLRRAARRDPLPAAVLWRMWAHCWQGLFSYAPSRRLAQRRRESVG